MDSLIHRSHTPRRQARSNFKQSPKCEICRSDVQKNRWMSLCQRTSPVQCTWCSAKDMADCSTAATRRKGQKEGQTLHNSCRTVGRQEAVLTTFSEATLATGYCTHDGWNAVIVVKPPTGYFIYLYIARINLQMNISLSTLIKVWSLSSNGRSFWNELKQKFSSMTSFQNELILEFVNLTSFPIWIKTKLCPVDAFSETNLN